MMKQMLRPSDDLFASAFCSVFPYLPLFWLCDSAFMLLLCPSNVLMQGGH